jgi:hypothetical protein
MSFLFPLYIAGLAAVAAPIVFHLIRRSTKGEVPFSSLMFLSPTPPRVTRRSRLDHWLLLLLRVTALGLLAFAFARPFLRAQSSLDFGGPVQQRIAVLVDTSASMRRGDLWPRAQALVNRVLDDCRPDDQLAIFAFDDRFRPLLSFQESAAMDVGRRQAVAHAVVNRLTPTWGGTHMGQALIDTVGASQDIADLSEKAGRMPRRIILISDLSQGSRLDALGDFEWPSDIELDLKTLSEAGANAGLEWLTDPVEGEPSAATAVRRVRVMNNPGSGRERFVLNWVDQKGTVSGKSIDVYVPPGESRVVRVPRPPASVSRPSLRLAGDAHGFDNDLYFADEKRREVTIDFIGTDHRDDPQGLLYYIERVFVDSPDQSVQIVSTLPSQSWDWVANKSPRLVILAAESPRNSTALKRYLEHGGTVLYVATGAGRADTLAALAGVTPWDIDEAAGAGGHDIMLREIAFDHPLFASLAGPQFNDFTKIRFMKYRRIDGDRLGDARVLARFENNDAAILEKHIQKGRLVVLASGWQPRDSQLARSSKFVPLVSGLIETPDARALGATNHRVGERVPVQSRDDSGSSVIVRKPDGTPVTIAGSPPVFDDTVAPGVYTIESSRGPSSFAVNLDPQESKTAPLSVETIEQFGVRLANHSGKSVDKDERRQMYNAELEGLQQLWRWLILAVIGILIFETWLAGRTVDRTRTLAAEALTT